MAPRGTLRGRSWPDFVTLSHDADQPAPTANPVAPPAGYGTHKILIFAAVSVALFMVAVDQTIVATALPSIQHELHTRINWAGWTITTYSLAQVLAMPVAGKLSDQFGRKTIFMCAAAVFTVASLCCGLSNSIYLLIAFRGAQALGGGAFIPSASGIVADQFGPDRDRALAMFTSILPIGGIVGPVLGGVFVTYRSWRGMFRQSGSILTISATTALLATAHHPAVAQSRVFLVFAVLMVALIPLILVVPEHHGQW